MDKNYYGPANMFYEIRDRKIHNAGLSIKSFTNFTCTFEVKNFTDREFYDAIGFPLPGISYFATFEWKF
ncbi:MAG: hypothetical protein SV062_11765 [Thermodesulfobacteriota bacterium]|nr:hypothetical protein [Thermodesulfobacteriota bacterium]